MLMTAGIFLVLSGTALGVLLFDSGLTSAASLQVEIASATFFLAGILVGCTCELRKAVLGKV
jgi:hypothetical protein